MLVLQKHGLAAGLHLRKRETGLPPSEEGHFHLPEILSQQEVARLIEFPFPRE
jgi:hypothetical protein